MNTRPGHRPKMQYAASLALCGLLAACAVTPNAIRDLPELPADLARDLVAARTAPVLVTKPAAPASLPVPRPADTPSSLAPSRACTAVYQGYVIYPITVCHPPSVLYETLDASAAQASATGSAPVPAPRNFKLTSHPLVRLGFPWFCTTRGGPWYAGVEGAQICNANPNIRSFKAEILGAPEPVVVTWSGTLADVPAPLNLVAISQTGEFCTCCSGVMCPDGSCKPNQNQCGVMSPAVK